jgi:hypothetical protein
MMRLDSILLACIWHPVAEVLILPFISLCHLGGIMIVVLATGSKVCGFKPGRGYGHLRAIKIRSTPPFRGEVRQSVPCRNILRNVKERCVV